MEAIVCATKNNSEALDLAESVGTLEPGKLADLLIINGDPLLDITVLADKRNIEFVYKDGECVSRLVG